MNDILISGKKITRCLPKGIKWADDRAPTLDEIRKIVEYPNRSIKAIVYCMASSGMRLGAWDYLRWGDIQPIIRKDTSVKIVIEQVDSDIPQESWNGRTKEVDP